MPSVAHDPEQVGVLLLDLLGVAAAVGREAGGTRSCEVHLLSVFREGAVVFLVQLVRGRGRGVARAACSEALKAPADHGLILDLDRGGVLLQVVPKVPAALLALRVLLASWCHESARA